MTKKEFDKTSFKKGMKIKIKDAIYELIGIDFELMLFGISINNNIDPEWHGIDECELISV